MFSHFSPLLHSPGARRAWQLITLILTAAVLYLALVPVPPPTVDTGWDKANHALAFACLAASGHFGFGGGIQRLKMLITALLALGLGIECWQYFEPTRSAEWADVLADAVGIALGLPLAALLARLTLPAKPPTLNSR